ncbi:MAG: aldo/keto reductase [Streptosporangiaceae bacterium]
MPGRPGPAPRLPGSPGRARRGSGPQIRAHTGSRPTVLRSPQVASIAARLGRAPAQIALAWLLSFRPNILLIPGTSSVTHLEENMAVGDIELDAAAREALASAG